MKTSFSHLAVMGGAPAFSAPLHVGRPNIGDRDMFMKRTSSTLDRLWLSNLGPNVLEFERQLAKVLGVKHCIPMCNGTVALEIAIRALGLEGEVIVPAFTFIATPNALQWQGITPVFCDVDPATHNLDPAAVERLITPKTTGIIGVHLWGRPCDVDALQAIADRRGLTLMFDASHAFGCSHRGRMIGNFGRAEVFSFHATKFINTLEGGSIATNDDELAAKIRLMKNFGFTNYDRTDYIGVNGKMNEISAAMGLTNLDSMDKFIEINRRNHAQYRRELAGLPGIHVHGYDEREMCNFQYVVLEIDEQASGISRDRLVQVLHAENVLARRYFYPGCHRMEPYKSLFPHAGLMLPVTEQLTERVLCLPTGSSIDSNCITEICSIVRVCVTEGTHDRLDRLQAK